MLESRTAREIQFFDERKEQVARAIDVSELGCELFVLDFELRELFNRIEVDIAKSSNLFAEHIGFLRRFFAIDADEVRSDAFDCVLLIQLAQIDQRFMERGLLKRLTTHFKFATRQFNRMRVPLDARRFSARTFENPCTLRDHRSRSLERDRHLCKRLRNFDEHAVGAFDLCSCFFRLCFGAFDRAQPTSNAFLEQRVLAFHLGLCCFKVTAFASRSVEVSCGLCLCHARLRKMLRCFTRGNLGCITLGAKLSRMTGGFHNACCKTLESLAELRALFRACAKTIKQQVAVVRSGFTIALDTTNHAIESFGCVLGFEQCAARFLQSKRQCLCFVLRLLGLNLKAQRLFFMREERLRKLCAARHKFGQFRTATEHTDRAFRASRCIRDATTIFIDDESSARDDSATSERAGREFERTHCIVHDKRVRAKSLDNTSRRRLHAKELQEGSRASHWFNRTKRRLSVGTLRNERESTLHTSRSLHALRKCCRSIDNEQFKIVAERGFHDFRIAARRFHHV